MSAQHTGCASLDIYQLKKTMTGGPRDAVMLKGVA
jgi:hypothetical protein